MNVTVVGAWIGELFAVAVLLLFLVVIWKIYKGDIDIKDLIADPAQGGKASLSRFQWLTFLFVIAGLYAILSIEANTMIEIPANVLGLLGISTGGFLVSKQISSGPTPPVTPPVVPPV
jgi:hypothetical protein